MCISENRIGAARIVPRTLSLRPRSTYPPFYPCIYSPPAFPPCFAPYDRLIRPLARIQSLSGREASGVNSHKQMPSNEDATRDTRWTPLLLTSLLSRYFFLFFSLSSSLSLSLRLSCSSTSSTKERIIEFPNEHAQKRTPNQGSTGETGSLSFFPSCPFLSPSPRFVLLADPISEILCTRRVSVVTHIPDRGD